MGCLPSDEGVDMICDSAELKRHAGQAADGAAQVFMEAWSPIWLGGVLWWSTPSGNGGCNK